MRSKGPVQYSASMELLRIQLFVVTVLLPQVKMTLRLPHPSCVYAEMCTFESPAVDESSFVIAGLASMACPRSPATGVLYLPALLSPVFLYPPETPALPCARLSAATIPRIPAIDLPSRWPIGFHYQGTQNLSAALPSYLFGVVHSVGHCIELSIHEQGLTQDDCA